MNLQARLPRFEGLDTKNSLNSRHSAANRIRLLEIAAYNFHAFLDQCLTSRRLRIAHQSSHTEPNSEQVTYGGGALLPGSAGYENGRCRHATNSSTDELSYPRLSVWSNRKLRLRTRGDDRMNPSHRQQNRAQRA